MKFIVWMLSPKRQMCYTCETKEMAEEYVLIQQQKHITRNYVFEIKERK